MIVTIHQQGNYETSDGYELIIKDIWYGSSPRVEFVVKGKLFSRTREQFEQAIREGKVIKLIN
jgi:hypothetical protein